MSAFPLGDPVNYFGDYWIWVGLNQAQSNGGPGEFYVGVTTSPAEPTVGRLTVTVMDANHVSATITPEYDITSDLPFVQLGPGYNSVALYSYQDPTPFTALTPPVIGTVRWDAVSNDFELQA